MIQSLRCPGGRRTRSAALLIVVIGAWLPSFLLRLGVAGSRAADDSAPITKRIDLTQRIGQEVHLINSQLGRAFALEPNYEYGFCDFVTVFEDANGHIRKIIDWAEGARQTAIAGKPPGPFTLRSIWEWYYDTKGEPIFLMGRYEGEPGSGQMQENIYYIHNVTEIERSDSSIDAYFYQSETNKDLLSSGRDELQSESKKLAEQGHKEITP